MHTVAGTLQVQPGGQRGVSPDRQHTVARLQGTKACNENNEHMHRVQDMQSRCVGRTCNEVYKTWLMVCNEVQRTVTQSRGLES